MNIQPPNQIKIGGLFGSYKTSLANAPATIPTVNKTPPYSTPIPYPNTAFSFTLSNGTTTVKYQGQPLTVKPSTYSQSIGDQPGALGGVSSNSFGDEFAFLTFCINVKMNGKNACCGTHMGTSNKKNTVSL